MATRKTISLQHIADAAGVSKATVSLALKNHPRISAATKDKIQTLAREMGYRPNPHLSKLMTSTKRGTEGDQGTIGFVRSGPTPEWNPVERGLFTHFSSVAEERGYQIEPFWLMNPDSSPDRVNRTIWTRGIEGVIIPMIHPDLYNRGVRTLPLEWDKFCTVELSDTLHEPRISGVRHNHFRGMLRTLAELEAAGYQRIGLTMWQDVELRTHHRWSAAYLLWKHIRGVSEELPLFLPEQYDTTRLIHWIEENRLDVVISPGLELYHDLVNAGLRIPEDIGYATLDQWGKESERVTGINQDRDGQIRVALDILIGKIQRSDLGIPDKPIYALNPGIWRQGTTTRTPPPGSSASLLDEERLLQP